jgi:DNA modification methylase
MTVRLELGDCLEVLPRLRRGGLLVDAVVTDPPYHLASIVKRLGKPDSAPIQSGATGAYRRASRGFMGQQWDGGDIAFQPKTWAAVLDVMKPGAWLVAFGGGDRGSRIRDTRPAVERDRRRHACPAIPRQLERRAAGRLRARDRGE